MKPKKWVFTNSVPPSEAKARKQWDAARHWEKTFAKHENQHVVIPEEIRHFRLDLFRTFKTQGQSATERLINYYSKYYNDLLKRGHMTKEEVTGVMENLQSFVQTMKALRNKKRKEKIRKLKNKK
jgi:hypothetical protein